MLKNFLGTSDHNNPSHQILLNHITPVSVCVSNKFDSVNKKFMSLVAKAKKNIDNEISHYYNNKEEEQVLLQYSS
jgi:hypothetical protein